MLEHVGEEISKLHDDNDIYLVSNSLEKVQSVFIKRKHEVDKDNNLVQVQDNRNTETFKLTPLGVNAL